MDETKVPPKTFAPIAPEVELLGKQILDAAYIVHTALGPGLLESVYEACLAYELRRKDIAVETQVSVPVKYKTLFIETGLRLDLWVERPVILELKSVEAMNPLFEAQLLTYLRVTGCRLGYLINFNVNHLKDGIKRMVL